MTETNCDLSVIIITLNEERNLRRCLNSLPRGCEIIVVDSQSSDATIGIAKQFGAIVYDRPFVNFQDQKNFALLKASRKWILSVDADEELSPKLCAEIVDTIKNVSSPQAFRLQRQLVFMGRRLRYGKSSDQPLRLFLREGARFVGDIHERVESNGETKFLRHAMLHYSYRDLTDYFERFNRYTSLVAANHEKLGKQPSMLPLIMRPWIEFISRYILRGGVFDGYPGYCYALYSSLYAFTKYTKLKELTDRK